LQPWCEHLPMSCPFSTKSELVVVLSEHSVAS